jgi:DnaJ homologue, subfamily C, member 28, conserved domain
VTERKPPGLDWESWIDRQIREATERGEFDHLPGAGKPIPDLDKPLDEMWWVKGKLRSEGLSYVPPSLALRKEAHDALEAVSHASSEAEVRQIIENINEQIREANRKGVAGPLITLRPFDVERVVEEWHSRTRSESWGDQDTAFSD